MRFVSYFRWVVPVVALAGCGDPFVAATPGDDGGGVAVDAAGDNIVNGFRPDGATGQDGEPADAGAAHHEAGASEDAGGTTTEDAGGSSSSSSSSGSSSGGPVDSGGTTEDAGGTSTLDGPSGCAAGQLECNGVCVPSDVQNCGSCGHSCTSLPHVSGGTTCSAAGACSFPANACAAGWADCNGNPEDGCETDVTQPSHCGGCSTACGTSAPVCAASGGGYACSTGCSASQSLCGGTCADTSDDAQNCGSCSHVCSGVTNGQPACVSSACSFTCNNGFSGCPSGSPTACVDEQNDPSNCGSCSTVCPGPTSGTGSPACVSGACSLSCAAGLAACPSANPTECVNEQTDPSNCGTCGKTCPAPSNGNGSAACATGACTFDCASGYTACPSEGQCDDLATDPANCGSCGHVCTTSVANASPTCSGSQCGFACNTGYALCNGTSCAPTADPNGVFVSAAHGSGSACTQASPCASIGTAASVAASTGKSMIYVDQGAYNEAVPLAANGTFTIDGGWVLSAGTWSTCNATGSTLSYSDGVWTVAVQAGTWTLKNFSVANDTTAAAGQTLYGVFVWGGSLTVTGSVTVAQGGDGAAAPATTGTGADGASGGCAPGGNGGGAGHIGMPGSATYTSQGYSQTPAQGGNSGDTGNVGTAGTNNCATSANTCTWSTTDATCDETTHQVCSTAGLGGCPGTGGPGGAPGGSGGSSIGVFAWGATVVVGGSVTAGRGGNGQNGASGNPGGNGVAGTSGQSATTQTCVKKSVGVCQLGTGTVLSATGGGPGGNGGPGGQGGGGSGGDSYCYYQGPGASVSVGGCSAGQAGTGGNQGTSSPAPGGHTGHYP